MLRVGLALAALGVGRGARGGQAEPVAPAGHVAEEAANVFVSNPSFVPSQELLMSTTFGMGLSHEGWTQRIRHMLQRIQRPLLVVANLLRWAMWLTTIVATIVFVREFDAHFGAQTGAAQQCAVADMTLVRLVFVYVLARAGDRLVVLSAGMTSNKT